MTPIIEGRLADSVDNSVDIDQHPSFWMCDQELSLFAQVPLIQYLG